MARTRDATIKAYFDDDLIMLFGTSYRTWYDQLEEYCRIYKKKATRIEISKEPWIYYGGLKWCSLEEFQNELNSENKGRTIDQFKFRNLNPIEINCCKKTLKNE